MVVNMPARFEGTPEERRANFESHHFAYDPDGDSRCYDCDSRYGSISAGWPCGADIPRVDVETGR